MIIKCDCIEIHFYNKYKRKWDLDNKASSLLDLLKDAGIIKDDNYDVVPKLIIEYHESNENKTVIRIS